MGFSQGVSGLNASANNLDVIGNNIANSGTVGFKSGSVLFSDVYAGSRVGLGTQAAGVSQNFASGVVQTTSRALDVAIVNGDGFFRLVSAGGELAYSRNGQFNIDKGGYIVNSGGLQLTGYGVGVNGEISGGAPTALQLPTVAMAPKVTQNVVAQFNLDSRSAVPTATPFDANNSTTFNYSNSVTVYDSLGNSHELATYFVKTGPNAFDTYATADGWPLNSSGAKVAPAASSSTTPSSGGAALATGGLGFSTTGALSSGGKISLAGLDFGNGAAPMSFTINVAGTTQFGNANDVKKLSQDGFTSGSLVGFVINKDGTVTGKYSNEQGKTLGQVALSSFVNPNGLQAKGDNVFSETSASGQPLTGKPGAGTKLGSLAAGALEASNVDLTSELVNLIIAQRTYQANAQTVKTQDQVMQTLVNLR